jgi:hypothetical protein
MSVGSPSLFALHNRGTGLERETSLPQLLQGFSSRDQQAWMDFIFETSNITEAADMLDQASPFSNLLWSTFDTGRSSHGRTWTRPSCRTPKGGPTRPRSRSATRS